MRDCVALLIPAIFLTAAACQADEGTRARPAWTELPREGREEIVRDAEGRRRGSVSDQRAVYDNEGRRIGTINDRGVLRDSQGRRLGSRGTR